MEVEYELRFGDYLAFTRYQVTKSKNARPSIAVLAVTLVVAAILGGVVLLGLGLSGGGWVDGMLFGMVLGFASLCVPVGLQLLLAPKRMAKQLTELRARKGVLSEKTRITQNEFASASNVGAINLRWSTIERLVELEGHLLLYFNTISAFIVPRRAFPNEEAFRAFCDTAKRYQQEAVRT